MAGSEAGGQASAETRAEASVGACLLDAPSEATEVQQREIENSVRATQIQVGDLDNIMVLKEEYAANAAFLPKIDALYQKYRGIRRSRGDGNCFYRSFLFRYFESIREDEAAIAAASEHATAVLTRLVELGYSQLTVGDFCEQYQEFVAKSLKGMSVEELEKTFRDDGEGDYLIYFARLATSAAIQSDPETFAPFAVALGKADLKSFCTSFVEPPRVEADEMQITGLASGFRRRLIVEYLDGSGGPLNNHVFEPSTGAAGAEVALLYRPGHYDLLYP